MPNSSNVPPDSVALKGRKSLPNRFSLVNSYDFVIRENCTKCKPTMPNCDSSKLMPLITVARETQWELEQQLRPSLILGPASTLSTATTSTLRAEHWLLFTFTLQPFEEQALMKENMCLLLVSCYKKDTWSSRAERLMQTTGIKWNKKWMECAGWRSKVFVRNPTTCMLTRAGRATRWTP